MKFNQFIKSDIDKIIDNANFNEEQMKVFSAFIHPSYGVSKTDVSIYTDLCISESKFYKIKKEIKEKCKRIMQDK